MELRNNYIVRGLQSLLRLAPQYFIRKNKFCVCGKNVLIIPPFHCNNYKHTNLGSNIYIGRNAFISTTNARLTIKDNISIAENLSIYTGNHARLIGKFNTDINEVNKPIGYDKDVTIEKDVWIGSNVTILSGVTIGRGATIAAGAVVTKDIPPYCVSAGVPAKPIKFYWTIDQIIDHESKLYSSEERFTKEHILEIFNSYSEILR